MSKFVSSKKTAHYVDDLHKVQETMARLRAKLYELAKEEDAIIRHLVKTEGAKSFDVNSSDGYLKHVGFTRTKRMIVDIDACRKLLRHRTPYKLAAGKIKAKVDYVYIEVKKRGSK